MSTASLRIHQLATNLIRALRLPTLIVIMWGLGLIILGAITLLALNNAEKIGTTGTIVISGILVLLALPGITLAIIRARWINLVARTPVPPPAQLNENIDVEARRLLGSLDEFELYLGDDRGITGRATRWLQQGKWRRLGGVFVRTEQLQRAVIKAAGGLEQAPYLRTDWRTVLLSFLGSCVAIVVSFVIVVILFLWWIVPV